MSIVITVFNLDYTCPFEVSRSLIGLINECIEKSLICNVGKDEIKHNIQLTATKSIQSPLLSEPKHFDKKNHVETLYGYLPYTDVEIQNKNFEPSKVLSHVEDLLSQFGVLKNNSCINTDLLKKLFSDINITDEEFNIRPAKEGLSDDDILNVLGYLPE